MANSTAVEVQADVDCRPGHGASLVCGDGEKISNATDGGCPANSDELVGDVDCDAAASTSASG